MDGSRGDPVCFATLAIAAALLGFAFFNRPPARLYLGDSGSLPLGLAAGTICVALALKADIVSALLPFGYYLIDFGSTLALRVGRHENLFQAHSQHAYQMARKAGRSEWWVLRRVILVNLVLAVTAWFSINATYAVGVVLAAVLATVCSFGVVVHFRTQGHAFTKA